MSDAHPVAKCPARAGAAVRGLGWGGKTCPRAVLPPPRPGALPLKTPHPRLNSGRGIKKKAAPDKGSQA